MVTISRVRVGWSGWSGGPGVSTFYTAAPPTSAQLAAIRGLFSTLQAGIPVGIVTQVENTGQQIDTVTGKAVDVWTAGAQAAVNGTAAGAYAAPCGVMIRWNTGAFTNGRLLRGKTFFVPIAATAYSTDGTLDSAYVANVQTGINTFITNMSGGLAVYSRRYQTSITATSGTLMDKAVVLTSRRA